MNQNAPAVGGPGRAEQSRRARFNIFDATRRPRDSHPPIDKVLDRLGHIRETGDGKWLARCPAHDDGKPSLSIRELSNGVVLLHCFAQCETVDVLHAIALDMQDLYPRDPHSPRREYSDDRLSGRECVALLDHELMLLAVTASHIAKHIPMSPEDAKRVALASSRIRGVVLDVTR